MKRFIAAFTKAFEIDGVSFKKGDTIVLQESVEYAPAYWIVEDEVVTTKLLTNEYGTIFKIVEEVKLAA